jgi:uncharacterized protein (TIGR03437 family)
MTYLGGGCNDSGNSIALDGTGNIWVSGSSQSPDFPFRVPFQGGGIFTSQTLGFISELNPDASALLFSSLSDSPILALNAAGVYQAGSSNGSATVWKIDPNTTPTVQIDAITPVSANTPGLTQPFLPGLAPGLLIEIKGRNLGPATKVNAELDSTGRLPFTLGGTTVRFGNIPAPLLSVQSTSIQCFAPFEISSEAQVVATSNGTRSNAVRMGVASSVPQILSIVNADGTANSADHPTRLGSPIGLYVSGLGQTNPLSADGLVNTPPLPVPVVPVGVYVTGVQLTPTFVGAAPGMIAGITQVNVTLPASLPAGAVVSGKLSISVNAAQGTVYVTQ